METNSTINVGKILSWMFGIVVIAFGVLNMFWGNDFFFGVFLVLLSLVYFLPLRKIIYRITNYHFPEITPLIVKFVVAIFVIWATFGVGDFFDKVDLMMKDL